MTATNHALTGAAIGLALKNPALALPVALISHYIMDALPHYGSLLPDPVLFKTRRFPLYLFTEALLCFLLVVALFVVQPAYWLLGALCAFVAAAPDLLSINKFLTVRRGKKWRPSFYTTFASKIQWFQRPIGAVVELVWFAAMLLVLAKVALI